MADSIIHNAQLFGEEVTLPFTPPTNGLLICLLRVYQSNARSYAQYSNTLPSMIDDYQMANCYMQGTLFVTKGAEVKLTGSTNLSTTQYYYFVSLK